MGFNIQLGLPTYIAFNNTASGALTANTRKDIFSIDHPVTSAKRVRITRIAASWIATTALAGMLEGLLIQRSIAGFSRDNHYFRSKENRVCRSGFGL
jgi:hypothetical protein